MSEEITIEMLWERLRKIQAKLDEFDKDEEMLNVARVKRLQSRRELEEIKSILNQEVRTEEEQGDVK